MRHAVANLDDVERVPLPARPAVVFCIYTSFGYGHLSRLQRVARALLARAPVDTYVIGCQPNFTLGEPIERLHEIDLPAPTLASDAPLRELPQPSDLRGVTPAMSSEELSAHKGHLLLALVRRLRPAAIALDSFPFSPVPGRDVAECEEALAHLAAHAPATFRCGGFRGIPSAVVDAARSAECRRLIEAYLDLLLIYIDGREREDFFAAHPHLRPVADRIRCVGYVAPPSRPRTRRPGASGARILATFGAGVDAYDKIRLACDATRLLAATRPDVRLDVVTGGRLPETLYDQLVADYGARDAIRLDRFVPGLAERLDRYDLVISMAGYNTCVELYAAGGRSIALPRRSETNLEQWAEALKFHAHGGIDHVLDSAATSPAALAALMADTLAAPPSVRAPLDMRGADAAAEILRGELERRGAVAARR